MIQVSVLNFLIVSGMVVIFAFFARAFAARNAENAWGQAAAVIL